MTPIELVECTPRWNRRTARTLERDWEAALAAEQHVQAEYEQFQACEPVRPNAMEQEAIRRLAEDVPALWRASTTTVADRQELVRLLLERVVVTVVGTTETVTVDCYWAGGVRTQTQIRRPIGQWAHVSNYDGLASPSCVGRGMRIAPWPTG